MTFYDRSKTITFEVKRIFINENAVILFVYQIKKSSLAFQSYTESTSFWDILATECHFRCVHQFLAFKKS
jgi:hypothetical protein